MRRQTMWLIVTLVAALVLMAGGAGALSEKPAPEAIVAGKINYQGRLTNTGGTPLTGTFPMRFQVYDDPAAGALLWDSGMINVDVDNGLFNVELAVDTPEFDGRGLWLRINVDGEWLTPRQELLPVPYALSLRPGARIVGNTGWGVEVFQLNTVATGGAIRGDSATSTAIQGYSTGGFGLAGYSHDNYAVYGYDGGSTEARGYGGYFHSDNGIGVYGYSNATRTANNTLAPGVYGKSANGVGVYGVGNHSSSGVGGYFTGRVGVQARSTGADTQYGYAGYFISENYRGLYVKSLSGWYDAYFDGVGGIYSAGGYWSLRADRLLVVNGGDETLEPGDVVALAGVVESPFGGEPLLAVRKADAAHASAVVGVAVQAMRLEIKEVEPGAGGSLDVQPVEGNITPKGYLDIVTGGLVPAVKVDVPAGGLEIGDLLTVSSTPGRAQKAGAGVESTGAILGKVAGPLDVEHGTVPVFVVLQ